MRITGGEYCGQKVRVPGGSKVRPTQDRVREALFSAIASKIPGCAVLDIFAGSGAVGLEAASRGAGSVCWVESDARVCTVLRENIARIAGNAGTYRVVRHDAIKFLVGSAVEGKPFDVIFADPPYDRDGTRQWARKALQAIQAGHTLADNGLFVMEQGTGEQVPESEGWSLKSNKTYGETRLLFWGLDDNET
jgi:16S rRNA (guanine966-N2)-methyltransferase